MLKLVVSLQTHKCVKLPYSLKIGSKGTFAREILHFTAEWQLHPYTMVALDKIIAIL